MDVGTGYETKTKWKCIFSQVVTLHQKHDEFDLTATPYFTLHNITDVYISSTGTRITMLYTHTHSHTTHECTHAHTVPFT